MIRATSDCEYAGIRYSRPIFLSSTSPMVLTASGGEPLGALEDEPSPFAT
jgi:hypothetical protein